MATFVRTELSWTAISQSPPGSNIEWLVTKIQETSVVNVYKPPPSVLTASSLPSVTAPAIYAGDFNCQHPDWGYNFFSAHWNTYTNPDLAFAVCSSNDPKPERRVIGTFPCLHHRPSVIKVPSLVQPVAGKPVKRSNFRKTNWQSYAAET